MGLFSFCPLCLSLCEQACITLFPDLISLGKLFIQKLSLGTCPRGWPKSILSVLSVTCILLYDFGLHFYSDQPIQKRVLMLTNYMHLFNR